MVKVGEITSFSQITLYFLNNFYFYYKTKPSANFLILVYLAGAICSSLAAFALGASGEAKEGLEQGLKNKNKNKKKGVGSLLPS